MRAFKTLAVAAVLLLAAGAAQAQERGKVHMANVLINPVEFKIGGGPTKTLPGGEWTLYDTDPGNHKVTVRLSSGEELSEIGTFANTDLTRFGSSLYWCVAVVSQDDQADTDPMLLLLTPDQCRRVLEAGEPID